MSDVKYVLNTDNDLLGTFDVDENKLNKGVRDKYSNYTSKVTDISLRDLAKDYMLVDGWTVLKTLILSTLIYYYPISVILLGEGLQNILNLLLPITFIMFSYVFAEDSKMFIKANLILILAPVLAPLKIVGTITPLEYKETERWKELKTKLKTISIFSNSLETETIVEERRVKEEKERKHLEKLEEENSGEYVIDGLFRDMIYSIDSVYEISSKGDHDLELVDFIKRHLFTEGGVDNETVNSVYKGILDNLNRYVELPNGYITRLYNILDSDSEGIKVTTDFKYLEVGSLKEALVDVGELNIESLKDILDLLEVGHKQSKEYSKLKHEQIKLEESEKERLKKLEYYQKNKDKNVELYESIKDKLTINNQKNRWEEKRLEIEESYQKLNKELNDIKNKV